MERLIDKNHPMYQKVQKVFDLMRELDLEFYLDKHDDLNVFQKSNDRIQFLIPGFKKQCYKIPFDNLELADRCEEEIFDNFSYKEVFETWKKHYFNNLTDRLMSALSEAKDFTLCKIINDLDEGILEERKGFDNFNKKYYQEFKLVLLNEIFFDSILVKDLSPEQLKMKVSDFKSIEVKK